jgi:hypothetical protein
MHRPHDVCAMHNNILFIKEGYATEIIYLGATPTRHCFYFGTVKSPNFVTAHNFVMPAENFSEALFAFQL